MTADAVYRQRSATFGAEHAALTRRWNTIANIRLAVFLLAVAALAWGIWQQQPLFDLLAGLGLVVFIGLVAYHKQLAAARVRAAMRQRIADEAALRLARTWDALPVRHTQRADPQHPYAADLDLFGPASLMQLLDSVSTPVASATLAGWLLAPADPATVAARQPAVAELAPLIDLRDDLTLEGRLMGEPPPDPAPFLAWAESPHWLASRQGLLWVGRVSVALTWVGILAEALGLVPYPVWVVFVVVNGVINWRVGGEAREVLEAVAAGEAAFSHYGAAFAHISGAPLHAPLLRTLQAALTAGGLPAPLWMQRLHRRATLGFPQDSMLYVPMQLVTLWDVHVFAALESWKAVAGGRVRGWLAALGEAEALSALAGLRFDNPDWALPADSPDAPALVATGLGHPLLPGASRVVNDVTVGPPGSFLLVTGSNMSGKSTLLRALGINIVLAQAGGPVCATALRLPPVALWTSMRLQDSLAQGVSFFMAELQRLKAIVDAARAVEESGGERRLFYLLDEILQGTNTAERQIAARRVILYLVHSGALGAVSTHDLTLADSPALAAAAQPIHFTETFTTGPEGAAMHFDYRVHPGIATSTNALRLMQIVGLDLPPDDAPARID